MEDKILSREELQHEVEGAAGDRQCLGIILAHHDALTAKLAKSRFQETRNYLASPAMATFADLKHSKAGTVLAMLGDGAISRGKCCEVLAQLAHGVPFDEIPLPEENGRQFSEDEIPAEVVAKLESDLAKERETSRELREALEQIVANAEWGCYAHTGEDHSPECNVGIARKVLTENARLIAKGGE